MNKDEVDDDMEFNAVDAGWNVQVYSVQFDSS